MHLKLKNRLNIHNVYVLFLWVITQSKREYVKKHDNCLYTKYSYDSSNRVLQDRSFVCIL